MSFGKCLPGELFGNAFVDEEHDDSGEHAEYELAVHPEDGVVLGEVALLLRVHQTDAGVDSSQGSTHREHGYEVDANQFGLEYVLVPERHRRGIGANYSIPIIPFLFSF